MRHHVDAKRPHGDAHEKCNFRFHLPPSLTGSLRSAVRPAGERPGAPSARVNTVIHRIVDAPEKQHACGRPALTARAGWRFPVPPSDYATAAYRRLPDALQPATMQRYGSSSRAAFPVPNLAATYYLSRLLLRCGASAASAGATAVLVSCSLQRLK